MTSEVYSSRNMRARLDVRGLHPSHGARLPLEIEKSGLLHGFSETDSIKASSPVRMSMHIDYTTREKVHSELVFAAAAADFTCI